MGDELKKEFAAEINFIAGAGGVYDISVNGKMLFSKFEKGRFPESGEIADLIKKLS